MWNQIFCINKALQSTNISLDQATKMVNSLNIFLLEMRDNGTEQIKENRLLFVKMWV